MYRIFSVTAFALVSVWASMSVAAESQTEELIVTAPAGNFLQPTQVLEGRELMLRKGATLGETLENEPGVSSTQYGKGASRPVIRGQAGPRVQVLKNNIATLDVSALSPDHNPTVEPLLVERIEVVRGPATLAYGSAAAGGVVNVLDGRIPSDSEAEMLSGSFEARGDTVADSKVFVGRLDGRVGQFAWHLDAGTGDSDDYEIAGFATADPAERPANEPKGLQPNSFTEFDAFAGGASWISDSGFTGVAVSNYETQYGLVGPESSIDGGPFIDMDQTRVDVRGEYALSGILNQIRFALGVNDYEHSENEADGEIATLFQNDEWEARVELGHQSLGGLKGTIGLQLNDRDLKASGEEAFVPDSEAQRWGIFAIENIETSIGQVQFGLRVDSADYTNRDFVSYDETAFSGAVGLIKRFNKDYEFVTNLSLSERVPDIEELYSNGLHIATNQVEVGLLAQGLPVEKEFAVNLDAGIEKFAGRWRWTVRAFYTDYDDYTYQRIAGEQDVDGELFPLALYAQDSASFWGAEAEVSYDVVSNDDYKLVAKLLGDFVEAELNDGSDLPRIPPARFGGALEYTRGALTTSLRALYHAKQDDISSFNTDSFTLVNLDAIYTFEAQSLDCELFIKGSNLFDEEARRSTSFVAAFSQLPGRNVEAGVRVMF